MQNYVRFNGTQDIIGFLNAIAPYENVYLMNDEGLKVNAHSYLGVLLAATEWNDNIIVHSERDIYSAIEKFIVIDRGDSVAIHN